jgi:hypothetical protein
MSGIVEVRVLGKLDRDASVFDGSITAIACPSETVGGIDEITIHGYLDGGASLFYFQKTAFALPPVAGGVQICICGNLDSSAGLVNFPVTAVALPTGPIGGFRTVCIGRHFDGRTVAVARLIALIAFPPAAIALCMGILGYHCGSALGEPSAGRE